MVIWSAFPRYENLIIKRIGRFMLKIVICDDEESIWQEITKRMKKQLQNLKVEIYAFSDGESLLDAMQKNIFHVFYLDIHLGDGKMDGYQLAQEIRLQRTEAIIVFLSHHVEFACEAYEVNALRFLKKPIQEDKFEETLTKVIQVWKKENGEFIYKAGGQLYGILCDKILYFEVHGRKMQMKLCDGRVIEFYEQMRKLIQRMEGFGFGQCYKSIYVRIKSVQLVDGNQLILINGEQIPLSRKFHASFLRQFEETRNNIVME